MTSRLSNQFEEAAVNSRQFTIFRPENTLEPVDCNFIYDMGKAAGLGVGEIIELKPERLAKHWLLAKMPLDIQVTNDEAFLAHAETIQKHHMFDSPTDPAVAARWDKVTSKLDAYRKDLHKNVDKSIEHVFDNTPHPDINLSVLEATHKIHRLITLRNDLGLCDFNEKQVRDMTRALTLSYFYNEEANKHIKEHVSAAIQDAVKTDGNDIAALPQSKKEKKHIQVSGGQGAGKTTLSRRTLGLKNGRKQNNEQSYIRINKDIFRPNILSAQEALAELDLDRRENRRQYGRFTEDELNMIKHKQWETIAEYSHAGKLPQMLIDITAVGEDSKTDLLANEDSKLTLLYINIPFEEAAKRVTERATGNGIPGVDTLRESLYGEMLSGHMNSAKEAASMLIHGVGKPIKLKVLDGISTGPLHKVQAEADLKKGVLDVYDSTSILEAFHKARDGKTDKSPTAKDLKKQVRNFENIAAAMKKINFLDDESGTTIATYDNKNGVTIKDESLYSSKFLGKIDGVILERLDEFHISKKALMLRNIAEKKGHIFEKRPAFGKDESLKIVTEKYETEVPVADRSPYIHDDDDGKILEWRHLAKRGKFLDGGFDPWRNKAPSDIRNIAARQVVDSWLTDSIVEQLVDTTADQIRQDQHTTQPATVHIAHPMKDYTRPEVNINYMVLAYATELTNRLNSAMKERHGDLNVTFARDRPMLALASDQATRTTANSLQRLTSQPVYDTSIFSEGDYVIFADEHVQAGGVMLAARNIQNTVGIKTLAYTALSSHNLGADLRINNNISLALETAIDNTAHTNHKDPKEVRQDLDDALDSVGLSRHTLSNLEGLTLIAYFIDGHNEAKRSWFESVKTSAGLNNEKIREGLDSLEIILLDKPITPKDLGQKMHDQVMMSRKAVYPSMG